MNNFIDSFPMLFELLKLLAIAFVVQFVIHIFLKFVFLKKITSKKSAPKLNKLYRYDAIFIISLICYLVAPLLTFTNLWLEYIQKSSGLVCLISGIFVASSIIDLICNYLAEKARYTDTALDDILVPLIQRVLKVTLFVFGGVFIASNLGANITSLLAGIGIGGIAIAMAAKNTLENLLGSITILFDQPFGLGDWVVIDGIEGTVESIGLRSTKIRTFYSSQISVPNSFLINVKVDNYGRRQYRRVKTMLSVTYDTPPESMEKFCEGIREIIRKHPYTRKDYFHVYFNQFSASSLDILLYCFLDVKDWSVELRERQNLFLDIIRLANRLEIKFAYPTQSIHMVDNDSLFPPEMKTSYDAINQAKKQGKNIANDVLDDTYGSPHKFSENKVSF